MNAKYVYSAPKNKAIKMVIVNAEGKEDVLYPYTIKEIHSLPRYTVCSVLDKEKDTLSFGIARCSAKDRFVKKIGRKLSYQRALSNPITVIQNVHVYRISEITRQIANQLILAAEQKSFKK